MKTNKIKISELAQKIVSYCEANFAEIESNTDIAEYFETNYQLLRRYTLFEYDKTPQDILDEVRLKKMKQLLAGSDLSCRHVGIAVGFINEVRSCRFFKRATGISMSEYRESAKSNKSADEQKDKQATHYNSKFENIVCMNSPKKDICKKQPIEAIMVMAQPAMRGLMKKSLV